MLLRVLSHMPPLVRLNRTRVGSPSWCGSFGPVRMQQSHSGRTKSRPNKHTVVSVHFQTNTGSVHPTSNRPNCKKNCAFLDWTSCCSPAALCIMGWGSVCSLSWQGRGHTWGCEEVWRIHPCCHLSVIAVCCLLCFTLSLFSSGSTVEIFPHALSDQSKSSLVNAFRHV